MTSVNLIYQLYSINFPFLSLVFISINHIPTPDVKMFLLDPKYDPLLLTKIKKDHFNSFVQKFDVLIKKYPGNFDFVLIILQLDSFLLKF